MIAGMTGTRKGLSDKQQVYALSGIPWDTIEEFHSGDCIGADAELHTYARVNSVWSVGHPPIKDDLRAYCDFDEIMREKDYFARNRDIVDASDVVYGFPPTEEDTGKGGTWYTINYAKKTGKRVVVITPKGIITSFN